MYVHTCVMAIISVCVTVPTLHPVTHREVVAMMYIMNQLLAIEGEGRGRVGLVGGYHNYHSLSTCLQYGRWYLQ